MRNNSIIEISEMKKVIGEWAITKPLIKKIYLFGSRASGASFRTGKPVRADSDMDIAIEVEKFPYDTNITSTWCCVASDFRRELVSVLKLSNSIGLDLQSYDLESPCILRYVEENSKILYSRTDQLRSDEKRRTDQENGERTENRERTRSLRGTG